MLKALSKYPTGFLVCSVNLVTACLLWFKNGANFIRGAHTGVVDHMVFAKPIEPAVDGGGTILVTVDSSIPANAEVINGRGKYLIPGLVDSHTHLKSPNDLLLYLATGVTPIRDLGGRQCVVFTTPLVVMA